MSSLDPCKHCAGEGRFTPIRDGMIVVCRGCGAKGPPAFHGPLTMPDASSRAAAGWNRTATALEHASAVSAQAGDLLVVFCDADTPEAYRQLRGALEPLSHALNVRVLALPTTARLERVEGDLLFRLGSVVADRWESLVVDPYSDRKPELERQTAARMVAEAAGELGLVILKPEKGNP